VKGAHEAWGEVRREVTGNTHGPRRSLAPGPPTVGAGTGAPWLCQHEPAAGTFDESARRASHEELAVARVLVAEGHQVRTVPERAGARSPDLVACGTSVEVKAFLGLEERGGRPPGPRAVANKVLDARGQGAVAVLWAGTSGLSPATARAGHALFCDRALGEGLGRLRAVRVIGPDFDISLSPAAGLREARQARLNARGPSPSPATQPRAAQRSQPERHPRAGGQPRL
jgi:hypothetical protein